MCYLLALYKKTERPDIEIVPITGVIRTRPFQKQCAPNVLDFISKKVGVPKSELFPRHIFFEMEGATLHLKQYEELCRLYTREEIDCHFYCVTKNPPKEVEECHIYSRDKARDESPEGEKKPTSDGHVFFPMANIDKKGVCELYQQLDLMESLFPLTRSCERDNIYVFTDETICKSPGCYSCQERYWGFGTYGTVFPEKLNMDA